MQTASMTATILLGLSITLPNEVKRTTHLLDKPGSRADLGWSPADWKKVREESLVAIKNAVIDGNSYPAAIIGVTDLSSPTVRDCLRVLVEDGAIEKYRIGKRFFYRAPNEANVVKTADGGAE